MTDDTDTPQGTEVAQPEQTDTIPDYVFFDPDEDTEEPEAPEMTEDDGTDEEDPEDVEAEAEEEGDEPEAEEEAPKKSSVKIELPDGTKIDAEEAAKGYLRQSDYTRKTSEVAEMRKTLEAETTRMSGITEAFIDFLSSKLPPAPNSALAYSNPTKYNQMRAAHEEAVAQVQKLVQMGEQVKETTTKLSETDRQKTIAEENARLGERFPQVATREGRKAFFENAAQAAEAAGFTLDELSGVTDHRMFTLAHYAKLGMEAQEKSQKAKAKAQKAPPATPQKPSTNKRQHAARNREAMKKLSQTGSIRDALRVDFE